MGLLLRGRVLGVHQDKGHRTERTTEIRQTERPQENERVIGTEVAPERRPASAQHRATSHVPELHAMETDKER